MCRCCVTALIIDVDERGGEAEQVGVKRVRKNTYRRVAVCVLFRDHR